MWNSPCLKRKNLNVKVFVLLGDGELNEGSVWEAIIFAAYHKLNNLILIIDNNKISMLGYQREILGLDPLYWKFVSFNWKAEIVDGHNIEVVYFVLSRFKNDSSKLPKVIIANTIKGKDVPQLENDSLCHVKSLSKDEIEILLES